MGNVTKQASTRFSIVRRSKGQSAVEKASYISRSILVSEFDGQTDRATLWNAVELSEKGQKSQLARMLKVSLPNDWSYELAEEVVRDYVQSGERVPLVDKKTAYRSTPISPGFLSD